MPLDWLPDDIRQWHIENDRRNADFAASSIARQVKILSKNVDKALKLDFVADHDRRALLFARQEMGPRWSQIESNLAEIKNLNEDLYNRLIVNLDNFILGFGQAANKGGASETAKLFGKRIPRAKQRERRRELNKPKYDAVTAAVLAAANDVKPSVKYPSEGKLAQGLYAGVRDRLKLIGMRASEKTIERRLIQLFENQSLSRSTLLERDL